MPININIKCTNGDKFAFSAETDQTVSEFKSMIEGQSSVPVDQQRLIYKGHVLQDARTLGSYTIEDGQTVILVRGARRADPSSAPAPAAVPGPAATPAQPQAFGAQFPQQPAAGAVNPFAAMMGGAAGFGGGMDLAQMQQQLLSNPEQMQAIMNSPMMQSLMENPEMIQNMFQNNPQFQEIFNRNPELAQVLNDPAMIRQSMQVASNPNLMREMMRNTDRAMSNIEAHPEGFNALRRMYENIQEPMIQAAQDASMPAMPASNRPQASTQASPPSPNAAPLPNPWASPNSPAPAAGPDMSALASMFSRPPAPQGTAPATGAAPQAGFGAAAFPGMPGMSPELLAQMMQDPFVQQMMQQMMSDPAQLQQMMNANPATRQMLEANPQMAMAFQNPAMVQAMTNPAMIQSVMQMMRAGQPQSANPAAAQQPVPPVNPFANLLNAQGGLFPPAAAAAPSNVQPEILYRQQLSQLNDMGFTDPAANLAALLATGGNVQAAIERLL